MNTYLNKYNKYKLKYLYLKGGGPNVYDYNFIDVLISKDHLSKLSNKVEIKNEINTLITKLKESSVPNNIKEHTQQDENYKKNINKILKYYSKITENINYVKLVLLLLKLLDQLIIICTNSYMYTVEQISCELNTQQGGYITNDIILIKNIVDLITIHEKLYADELYEKTYNNYKELLELPTPTNLL
jgi:hypothetical protein